MEYERLLGPFSKILDTQVYSTDFVVFFADLGGDMLAEISSSVFGLIKSLIERMGLLFWVPSSSTGREA